MITGHDFDKLRNELSIKSKNGIDFTFAASIVWAIIALFWAMEYKTHTKSIYTFMIGGIMLPMALGFSKIFKTTWKNKNNPLQPLGLWLNFAQLFYFPFLFFVLNKMPDYFVMTYTIITGAHFFPYAWFYKTKWYAIFAGIISIGTLFLGLKVASQQMYWVPLATSLSLLVLTLLLWLDSRTKQLRTAQA